MTNNSPLRKPMPLVYNDDSRCKAYEAMSQLRGIKTSLQELDHDHTSVHHIVRAIEELDKQITLYNNREKFVKLFSNKVNMAKLLDDNIDLDYYLYTPIAYWNNEQLDLLLSYT